MVTDWLVRHWRLLIIILMVSLLIIIGLTIWITISSDHWLAKLILKYFDSWSIALSAAATFILACVAVGSIIENRRIREEQTRDERHRQALERVRNWAESLFELVTRPTRHTNLQRRLIELDALTRSGGVKSVGILYDAEQLGGDVNAHVKAAHLFLFKFVARLHGTKEINEFRNRYGITETIKPINTAEELEEAKRTLLESLGDVISAVTKKLVPLEEK